MSTRRGFLANLLSGGFGLAVGSAVEIKPVSAKASQTLGTIITLPPGCTIVDVRIDVQRGLHEAESWNGRYEYVSGLTTIETTIKLRGGVPSEMWQWCQANVGKTGDGGGPCRAIACR